MSSPRLVMYFDVQTVNYILQAYLVYKYRGKNNEVQHTTMMSKGGGSRQLYGTKPTLNTDTITSNANSTFERYADKSNTEGESESLLEKDIQVHNMCFVGNILYYLVPCISSYISHSCIQLNCVENNLYKCISK